MHLPADGSPRGRLAAFATALLLAGLLLATLTLVAPAARAQFWFGSKPMPEFANGSPAAWINSPPLRKADLAGQVVLIEIWTSV